MSSDIEFWPPPNDPVAFESLCLELWREIWNDPGAQKNGRSGQPQAGVDVFSQRAELRGGIQCKQKDGLLRAKLTESELRDEAQKAESFRPVLKEFIVATSGPRDVHLQQVARLLSESNQGRGIFTVEVWSWPDIWPQIYQRKALLDRIGPEYWPRLYRDTSRPVRKKLWIASGITLVLALLAIFTLPRRHIPISAVPAPLPRLSVSTLDGLPEKLSTDSTLRMHRLYLKNTNSVAMVGFCGRLQFPEPITDLLETNASPGTTVYCRPLRDKLAVVGTGGRSEGGLWIGPTSAVYFVESPPCFIYSGPSRGQKLATAKAGDITGVWELGFDRLAPGGQVILDFLTSVGTNAQTYLDLSLVPLWKLPPNPQTTPDTNELRFSLEGEFSTEADTAPRKQTFILPLIYEPGGRRVESLDAQSELGRWQPVTLILQ